MEASPSGAPLAPTRPSLRAAHGDVDHFKEYNDAYGPAGDEALARVATILAERRRRGLRARYGVRSLSCSCRDKAAGAIETAQRIRPPRDRRLVGGKQRGIGWPSSRGCDAPEALLAGAGRGAVRRSRGRIAC